MTEAAPPPAKRPRRLLKRLALGFGIFLAFTLGLLAYMGQLGDNLREVAPGKYYRSGQMSAESLARTIQRHQIQCVVNLRGEKEEKDWYQEELRVCREAGIEFAPIRLSATSLPPPDRVQALIERFEKGPYPMLVHCQAGADRTGLATVVYGLVVEKKPLDEALSQLTWHYGHVPIGPTSAMDRFFEMYRETGGGRDIKTWTLEKYPKLYEREPKD
jgi:protein tyrosine/serine phosphatase